MQESPQSSAFESKEERQMEVSDGCRDLFPVISVCWICAVEVEMLLLLWITAEASCTRRLGLGLHQYKTTWYFFRVLEGKVKVAYTSQFFP